MEVTENKSLVKVFLPKHCLQVPGDVNISIGYLSLSNNHICIVETHSAETLQHQISPNLTHSHGDDTSRDYELVICLQCRSTGANRGVISRLPPHLRSKCIGTLYVEETDTGIVSPKCVLNERFRKVDNLGVSETLVIVYDAVKLRQSAYFAGGCDGNEIAGFLLDACRMHDILVSGGKSQVRNQSGLNRCGEFLYGKISGVLSTVSTGVSYFKAHMESPLWQRLCSMPAVCEQINRKYTDFCCNTLHEDTHRQGVKRLRYRNSVWRTAVDVLLGLCVMWWFMSHHTYCYQIADHLLHSAQQAATELQRVLKWMMGAPAGLKLNSQLTHFMAKFFLYHIYLWTAYLNVLKPVLAPALWYISLSGCLGVTVQLSLIQDLLSMMTLHIYCFYVYAARLYALQLSGLLSLWRLFRGKKWNALRGRVDSAQYDMDQLFIGTLFFTILLFLLPTTGLYYLVFLLLRLVVVCIQGCLYKVISLINNTPIYFLYLRLTSPHILTDDFEFEAVWSKGGNTNHLVMKLKPASLHQLLCEGQIQGHRKVTQGHSKVTQGHSKVTQGHSKVTYSWGDMLQKICAGSLIYPWLEK